MCLLKAVLKDKPRPDGSRAESLLDVVLDDDGRGAAVKKSNPESNPREYQ